MPARYSYSIESVPITLPYNYLASRSMLEGSGDFLRAEKFYVVSVSIVLPLWMWKTARTTRVSDNIGVVANSRPWKT